MGRTVSHRAHDLEAPMSRTSPNERLAILEQKVSHMEEELDRMAAKVDEMHAILLQARGVRWAIIAVSGLVGFLAGISHWFIARP
jgi:cob(I)alamin adenosyltransferase